MYGYTGFSILNQTGAVGNCLPAAGGHRQHRDPGRDRRHGDPALRAAPGNAYRRATRRCCIRRRASASCAIRPSWPAFIFMHNAARMLGESFQLAREGVQRQHGSRSSRRWQACGPGRARTRWSWASTSCSGSRWARCWPSCRTSHIPSTSTCSLRRSTSRSSRKRRSIGELSYINLDDQTIEQFGAAKMSDLGWEQIMDSYACIMCFRCQEVCPAYNTGKVLSPAALEINKRYHLNERRRHGRAPDDADHAKRRCGPARPAAPAWTSARWATSRCATSWTSAATCP